MEPEELKALSLRPNPAALLAVDDDDDDGDNDDSNMRENDDYSSFMQKSDKKSTLGSSTYKIPKLAANPYKDGETIDDAREEKLLRKRKKLKNSEILETLREEFGTAPETSFSSGIGSSTADEKILKEMEEERRRFEEDRFVRLTVSRKEKKEMKKRQASASKVDLLADIGDIGEFEELAQLSKGNDKNGGFGGSASEMPSESRRKKTDSSDITNALKQAMAAFTNSKNDALSTGHKKQKENKKISDDAIDDEPNDAEYRRINYRSEVPSFDEETTKSSKRRRAPLDSFDNSEDFHADDHDDGDQDDSNNFFDEFSKKKKEFNAAKKSHYSSAAEPRYGSLLEDDIEDGKRRAATYEIIQNRGLTPHRKKANRNPRVKKKEQYAKALKSRKGIVREAVSGAAGQYSGETTGIKMGISKSRRISN
jgi:hypothetical protein